jgi:3-oxoadipate enol-lactonase
MNSFSTDRYLELRGARMRYRSSGAGPALVLIHGWALDLDMWEPLSEELGKSYRMIRFDRRGFGLSGGRPSLVQDASDLIALLEHLEVARFALLGMSQGARIALALAGAQPERVSALILDGPPFIDSPPPAASIEIPYESYRTVAQTQGLDVFRREWRANPLTQLHGKSGAAQDILDLMLERYPGNDLTDAMPAARLLIDLRSITSGKFPTLILTGEHDVATRQESAQWLAARIPGSERRQIANAGHLSGLDNPSLYNHVVTDFLKRHAIGTKNADFP